MDIEVKIDSRGRIKSIGGINGSIDRYEDGRVCGIGNMGVEYHGNGKLKRIGGTYLKYESDDGDGCVQRVSGDGKVKVTIE